MSDIEVHEPASELNMLIIININILKKYKTI